MPTLVPWQVRPINRAHCSNNILPGCKVLIRAPGTAIAKVFNLTAASTETSEKSLQARKLDFSHAVALPRLIPHIIPARHRLRLNSISPLKARYGVRLSAKKALTSELTSWLPPCARSDCLRPAGAGALCSALWSGKGPVNIVGYIAENMLAGRMEAIYLHDIITRKDCFILDVRENGKWKRKIASSIIFLWAACVNACMNAKDENNIVCCQVGKRAMLPPASCGRGLHKGTGRRLRPLYAAVTNLIRHRKA